MTAESENLELVRKLIDVYNERSFVENFELVAPDFVWDMSRVLMPDGTQWAGRSDVRGFFENWGESWGSDQVEGEEMVDLGQGRVLVMILHRLRGRGSGVDVAQRYAMVWTLSDGRAQRVDIYPTRDEALEDAGTAPPG
jgi:ketosteroid isomerase-like protein